MKACVRLWSASNQLKAPVAQMSDSILHQINNHPVDIHVLRKAKGVQTTTYCMRCNHLEQTPAVLFPCGMFQNLLFTAGASCSKGGVFNGRGHEGKRNNNIVLVKSN